MTGYESKRAAAQEKLAQPAQEPVAVYGYCPECGAKSVMRERRPNGNDKCANGHTYPSNTSTPPQPAQEPVACAECERLRSALKRANGLAEHFERAWYLRGDEIEQLNAQPAQEPVAKYCCHVCFDKSSQTFLDRMILCSECGNKRCPKATNHALPCTNSNNPLQPAQEREALKLALKVLEDLPGFRADIDNAITAIKEALAQPEQEPVAWLHPANPTCVTTDPTAYARGIPLYTAPPQRPWVGLTDEEIALIDWESLVTKKDCVQAVEAKLKEKNT